MEGSTSGESGDSPDQLDKLFCMKSVNIESLNGRQELSSPITRAKKV